MGGIAVRQKTLSNNHLKRNTLLLPFSTSKLITPTHTDYQSVYCVFRTAITYNIHYQVRLSKISDAKKYIFLIEATILIVGILKKIN